MKKYFNEEFLYLSKSVKVIIKKSSEKIPITAINKFFNKVCSNKVGNYLYKNKEECGKIRYYLRIFKVQTEPTFLKGSMYRDEKYGLCLLIEYDKYIIIKSKYCNLSKNNLSEIGYGISRDKFSYLLVDENSEIKGVRMYNAFDVNSTIKSRELQGNSLENNYTPTYLSRNVLTSMRFKGEKGVYSQSLDRSNITEMSSKTDFSGFLIWCKNLIDSFREQGKIKYLNNFAQCVKYSEVRELLEPELLLFKLSDLKDEKYKLVNEKDEELSAIDYIDKYDRGFELYRSDNSNNKYSDRCNFITIRKLKNKININVDIKENIYVVDTETMTKEPLEELLIDNAVLLFKNIKYSYISGSVYIDNYLINNKGNFLKNFKPMHALKGATSEKGECSENSSNFEKNSIFGILTDNIFSDYDYIVCDDLGNEVADFIGFSEDKISFFQAKANKSKFSASSFQEVIGQAIKNIPYLSNIENMNLDSNSSGVGSDKKRLWKKTYSKTRIPRLLKPRNALNEESVDEAIDVLKEANKNDQTIRKMIVVVNFISRKDLAKELENETKPELKQIVWLLSNFIGVCQESNIIPLILCKE